MNLLGLASFIFIIGSLGVATASTDNGELPSWIKEIAKLWGNDQISDREFMSALQYLVSNGIIVIPAGSILPDSDTPNIQTDTGNTESVPVTIMQSMPPVYDSWLRDREGNETGRYVSFNHISLLKGWNELDGAETFDRLQMLFESAKSDFKANDTRQDRIEKLDLFFGSDRDFAPYWSDVSYDEMVRYTDDYIGDKILVEGTVFEVKDKDDGFKISLTDFRLNFDDNLYGNVIVVDYDGPRLRDGDSVLIAGEISGLEVVTVRHAEILTELHSNVGDGSLTSIQVETVVVEASDIQVMADPYDILPRDLEKIALKVPHDQYKDNKEILDGLVVYAQGKLIDDDDRNSLDVDSFRINVSSTPTTFDPINVWSGSNVIDLPDSNIVGVYGLCTYDSLSTIDPSIYAIHVFVP